MSKRLIKEIDWRGKTLSSIRKPRAYSDINRQFEIEGKIRYCCFHIAKKNLYRVKD